MKRAQALLAQSERREGPVSSELEPGMVNLLANLLNVGLEWIRNDKNSLPQVVTGSLEVETRPP